METKYDYIVNLLLDNWIIAIIVIVAIIIMSLPSLKEGVKALFTSSEKSEDFIIEYADEKIVCKIILRTYDFEVVKICASTHRLGVLAERKWINKFYPNYNSYKQSLNRIATNDGEKVFDIITIRNENIKKNIYFDITDFFDGAPVVFTGNVHEYAKQKIIEIYNQD